MGKPTAITVDVNCNLQVDWETALACLQLVQVYLNSNPDLKLTQKRLDTGEVELIYEPIK